MPFVNCDVTVEQAKEAYEQHGSYLRAGEALGVSRATIKRRLQHLQGHRDENDDPNEQIKTVHGENGMQRLYIGGTQCARLNARIRR